MISTPRRRKMSAFFVLVMLLYGKHASVCWTKPYTCVIATGPFTRALGINTTHLRKHLEWLARYGYVKDLHIQQGSIGLAVVPPPARSVEVA